MITIKPGQTMMQSVAGGEVYELERLWWTDAASKAPMEVTSVPPHHKDALKVRRLEDGEIVRATSWVAPGETLSSPIQLIVVGGVAGAVYRIQVTPDSCFFVSMLD